MCVGLDLWQCFADFIVASKFYSEYCFGNSEGWRNRKGTELCGGFHAICGCFLAEALKLCVNSTSQQCKVGNQE